MSRPPHTCDSYDYSLQLLFSSNFFLFTHCFRRIATQLNVEISTNFRISFTVAVQISMHMRICVCVCVCVRARTRLYVSVIIFNHVGLCVTISNHSRCNRSFKVCHNCVKLPYLDVIQLINVLGKTVSEMVSSSIFI
jgi:hypothetical protein